MAYSEDWGMQRIHTYLYGTSYTTQEVQEALTNATRIIRRENMSSVRDLSWLSTTDLVEELNKRKKEEVARHTKNIKKSIECLKQLGINVCDSDNYPAFIDFKIDTDCSHIVLSIEMD